MENKMNIKTEKPIAFLKVKTTGLKEDKDRILEVSIVRVEPDGTQKVGTRIVNPEIELTEEIVRISGITNEMVAGKPTFKEIASNLLKFVEGCDFAGFNIHFDFKFLQEEFSRSGLDFSPIGRRIIDLMEIYHGMEPKDFRAALMFYNGEKVDRSQIMSSEDVNKKSIVMLNSMIEKYNGKTLETRDGKEHVISNDMDTLNKLFNKKAGAMESAGFIVLNEGGRPIFSFGKYEGKLVSESLLSDNSYYNFLISKSDFPADTKNLIKRIYAKAEANLKTAQQKA